MNEAKVFLEHKFLVFPPPKMEALPPNQGSREFNASILTLFFAPLSWKIPLLIFLHVSKWQLWTLIGLRELIAQSQDRESPSLLILKKKILF